MMMMLTFSRSWRQRVHVLWLRRRIKRVREYKKRDSQENHRSLPSPEVDSSSLFSCLIFFSSVFTPPFSSPLPLQTMLRRFHSLNQTEVFLSCILSTFALFTSVLSWSLEEEGIHWEEHELKVLLMPSRQSGFGSKEQNGRLTSQREIDSRQQGRNHFMTSFILCFVLSVMVSLLCEIKE